MKIVSLILARGGSKGIPNKNIIKLNNKPLISYVINASLKSNVNETWVSSDSDEILKISKKYGSKIIKRPDELSTDFSTSEDALIHFAKNIDFDILVFIQPTSPLLKSKYINKGLKMIINKQYDSVFSAYEEHWKPFWSNVPIGWDINNRPRRQDKEKYYVENGAFYITTRENLLSSKNRYSGNIGKVIMPINESFQIDTFDDLELIKKLI